MSSLKRVLLCAALLILAAGSASAQTGSITGTITTATTVTPTITVYDTSNRQVAATTGASYTVSGLAPGNYFVTAAAPGYVTELYNDIACVAADCVPASGTPVSVAANTTATADFTLTSGGGIQGTVRRASDTTAVSAVAVFLYNAATSLVGSTVTAADGGYSFTALPAGNYFLRVGAPQSSTVVPDYVQELFGGVLCPVIGASFGCRISQGTPVAVVAAGTSTADFSLDHGARINGQVTSAGTGVAGVTITAYSGSTPIGVATTTDATGFYTVQGLAPGTYFVRATPPASSNLVEVFYLAFPVGAAGRPTSVTVAAGAAATGINFPLAAGGAISGTVSYLDPNAGGTHMSQVPPAIEIYNASGTLVRTRNLADFGLASPIAYTVNGLPTGNYYVKIASIANGSVNPSLPSGLFIDELHNGQICVAQDCRPTSGTPVAVTAGQNTNGINFALETGGTILGTATTQVDIYDSRGVLLPRRTYANVSAGAGIVSYGATGLPSGTYYLVGRRTGRRTSRRNCIAGRPARDAPSPSARRSSSPRARRSRTSTSPASPAERSPARSAATR